MANAMTIYFHMDDMTPTQDPGAANHGIEFMERITDYRTYMKDVARFFANPTDYVAPAIQKKLS